MDLKKIAKQSWELNRESSQTGAFKEFDATQLYCPRCKQAVPVRKRILLVLPEGDKYEYLCEFCLETVGTKMDKNRVLDSIIV